VFSINEGPEMKQLSGVSEIVIKCCIAVILGVQRNFVGDLTAGFFLLEGRLS
jgi:ABC-type transport system involved in cytochrome c biogenesis permease component